MTIGKAVTMTISVPVLTEYKPFATLFYAVICIIFWIYNSYHP